MADEKSKGVDNAAPTDETVKTEKAKGVDNATTADEAQKAEKAKADAVREVETSHDALKHPDGSHRMLTIARENGAGEREITAEEWERHPAYHRAGAGAWRIIKTEVVGANHSDDVY